MDAFLQTLILGAGRGALDALLAFGIVLIYRTTGVLNFAQAATGTVAAYVIYSVGQSHPLVIALPAGILVGAALGAGTYRAISGIQTKHFALTSAVATLAMAILFQQLVRNLWGTTSGQFPDPFGTSSWDIGSISILYSYLWGIITAAVLAIGIGAFLKWTKVGTMLRALADNPEAARLCGGSVPLLVAGIWAAAGGLAAIAGFFAAQIVFEPSFLDSFFVASLIAAVLGGLRSLTGAFIGAMGLEMADNLFTAYAPENLTPYTQTFLILLLIAVLVLVPRGWLAAGERRLV